ncbi:MAG TPA: phosphatase PAP2 family protein, partial [Thermoanaerobaculia bacterium]|nr:phosphatase PAP2 family protein [Thermoanaerobaculia bacterium]
MTALVFASLDAAEIVLVQRAVAGAERLRLVRIARIATRLGNGSVYPIVSLLLIAAGIDAPLRFLASSALSLLSAFAIYPTLKKALARERPCDYVPSLARFPEPIDHYSCPSGHAMTAAAYGIPLIFAWPAAAPVAIALWATISWS